MMNNYNNRNNKKMSVVEDRVCVKYEIGFKSSEMEKVKLMQQFDDGTKKTFEAPKFSGKEGAEGLIYVYKAFKNAAKYLVFDEGEELFFNWELCLVSTAEENWKTLMDVVDDQEKTPDFFEECFQFYLLKYCTADARDVLIDYLKTFSCKKPHDADVRVHGDRIRSLCVLANSLPGTMPELNEAMRKKILFDTFPGEWQIEFHKSRVYADASEQDIMDFMSLQKTSADNKERKRVFGGRGGGPPAQRGRFGGRGPGRGFGRDGRGFGFGGRGFNGGFNGGRGNFFRNGYNNGHNNGFQRQFGFGNGNGSSGYNNNGNGGRFQSRYQNFNRGGRGTPQGRAPMGREPAARQHGYMIEGREPQDGRAYGNHNGSSNPGSRTQQQQHYFYDDGFNGYDEQQQYYGNEHQYDDGNYWQQDWQQEYGGFDNFYTDYDESQAGW